MAEDLKVFKVPTGVAGLAVGKEEVYLSSGGDGGFYAGQGLGASITGKTIALNASPMSIQFCSMAVLNPMALFGIPSTFVTPTPTFIFQIPGIGTLARAGVMAAAIAGLYASMGV